MPQLIPTTEPFFFPADSKAACLLVHGFTGTPKETRWMGEYLHRQGFTVLGIRLGGHSTRPEDLIRSKYTDWLASFEDGFHLLSGMAERVHAVGFSMGGSLALLAASYLPVMSIVSMSAPYKLPDDWRLGYTEIISRFVPYLPKRKGPPGAGWVDKEAWRDHISYPQNPVRSLGELNKLLGELRAALPKLKTPTLVMHSRNDNYVPPLNADGIYNDLGSPDKHMLWIENSGHALPRDAQRETVFRAAVDFIRRIENGPHAS